MAWARPAYQAGLAQAYMAHLARTHEVVERAHHLFGWGKHVPGVQQVEVDIVGAEPFQRSFDGAQDVLAAIAAGVRIAGLGVVGELAGDHRAVAQAALGDQLAEPGLAVPPV